MTSTTGSACFLCGQGFSLLRQSVQCNLCQQRSCSSCCRPAASDPKLHICVACIRKQQKAQDPNDDRPKWLREAQDLRKTSAGSSGFLQGPLKPNLSSSKSELKNTSDDDRPKWLREAQEKREDASQKKFPVQQPNPSSQKPSEVHDLETRLTKLKDDLPNKKPVLTEEELHDRVARLKDQDPASTSRQPDYSVLRPPPKQTEAEEIESLITQLKDRVNLEEDDQDLVQELESRLRRLKAETANLGIVSSAVSSPTVTGKPFSDTSGTGKKAKSKKQRVLDAMEVDDSDEELERVTKLLTSKLPKMDSAEMEDDDDEAFCIICPDDPTVICLDCDGDKYCTRCFKECHREWCMPDHRSKKLQRKPNR